MTTVELLPLVQHALILAALLALPVLAALFGVALVLGIAQAVTGVQDVSVGQIPRMVVGVLVFAATLPWIMSELAAFGDALFATVAAI